MYLIIFTQIDMEDPSEKKRTQDDLNKRGRGPIIIWCMGMKNSLGRAQVLELNYGDWAISAEFPMMELKVENDQSRQSSNDGAKDGDWWISAELVLWGYKDGDWYW